MMMYVFPFLIGWQKLDEAIQTYILQIGKGDGTLNVFLGELIRNGYYGVELQLRYWSMPSPSILVFGLHFLLSYHYYWACPFLYNCLNSVMEWNTESTLSYLMASTTFEIFLLFLSYKHYQFIGILFFFPFF